MLVSKWIFVCSHHFHPFHRQRHFSNSVFFIITTVIITCNTHCHYSRSNRSRFRASACLSGLGIAQKPPSRRVTNSLSSTLDLVLSINITEADLVSHSTLASITRHYASSA